jgi:hypothetical protein
VVGRTYLLEQVRELSTWMCVFRDHGGEPLGLVIRQRARIRDRSQGECTRRVQSVFKPVLVFSAPRETLVKRCAVRRCGGVFILADAGTCPQSKEQGEAGREGDAALLERTPRGWWER